MRLLILLFNNNIRMRRGYCYFALFPQILNREYLQHVANATFTVAIENNVICF